MKTIHLHIFIISFLLAFLPVAYAADNPRDRLERLHTEIDSLSNVLAGFKDSERDIGGQLSTLEQQISTRKRLIRELDTQRDRENKAIAQYNRQINGEEKNLDRVRTELRVIGGEVASLEKQVSDRAVHLYKQGNREALKFIVAATDPGDFVRRRIYVERIHDVDRRNLNALRSARKRQTNARQELESSLAGLRNARERKQEALKRVEQLASEARVERRNLESNKASLDRTLTRVRRDRDSVQKMLADREAAAAQVEEWIVSLERRRLNSGTVQEVTAGPRQADVIVRDVRSFKTFSSARGRLPWPVKGTVLRRFGPEKNQSTGTITDNPGVDIRAREGDEVLAVQSGICTLITYLRGFGTTILLEHGEGYYTVYAHLGEVLVSEGETVEAGRVIATVGSTGGAGNPMLHFQVWQKREKQDPLRWLSS